MILEAILVAAHAIAAKPVPTPLLSVKPISLEAPKAIYKPGLAQWQKTLLVVHLALGEFDGIQSVYWVKRGHVEHNPLMRPFNHNYSTAIAVQGAVAVFDLWLSQKMRTSSHKFLRRTAWLPQAVGIVSNLHGVAWTAANGGFHQ